MSKPHAASVKVRQQQKMQVKLHERINRPRHSAQPVHDCKDDYALAEFFEINCGAVDTRVN